MAAQDSFAPDNMPEQRQPRGPLRGTIILWLVAISGIVLLIPLYLVATAIRNDADRLSSELQAVQVALASESTLEPEAQKLADELAQLQGSVNEIDAAHAAVAASHTNWPAVMAAIGNYDPSQVALTSVTQSDNQITLNGRAIDDPVVIAYSRALEESNLFSRVIVQSVRLVATPFASPVTATVEPGATVTSTVTVTPTVTPTPIPDPTDEYEMDDFSPQPIFMGEPQLHNFYPIYDVDRVQFLAKAGRYYQVSTADLSSGVDTFLTVIVGGTAYTNDDREPGVLSSEVLFRGGSSDVWAIVKVTNRGQYDPDSWYQITVEEIIPTPVPTATSPPTPTLTSTPFPSATPENTPTPTPDLRDEYEPDDTDPPLIDARGETQRHNFYPDNDVDWIEFWAKSGYWYRVFTSDLALRVDTVLIVTVGGTSYTNDDREPHEPGDLSSEVVFQVGTGYSAWALVEVANQGDEYGPDKWYQVTVEEIIPSPTPTPTPVPTSTTSSSSDLLRSPGVASLVSGFASSDVLSSSAVEFVIVVELKAGSP